MLFRSSGKAIGRSLKAVDHELGVGPYAAFADVDVRALLVLRPPNDDLMERGQPGLSGDERSSRKLPLEKAFHMATRQ